MKKVIRKPAFIDHDKTVEKIMAKNLVSVKFSTILIDAISKMKEHKISGLVVLDNVGEFIGIVSALDVFKTINGEDDLSLLRVEDIMTPFTITVPSDQTIREAAITMMENNIHRLVVTDSPTSRKPIGIVTSTDLINNIL
jgi:CBS domain-containing protein